MLDCTSNPAVGRHSIFNNTGRIFNSHLTQPNLSLSLSLFPSFLPLRDSISSFRFPFLPYLLSSFIISIPLIRSRSIIDRQFWIDREREKRPLPSSPFLLPLPRRYRGSTTRCREAYEVAPFIFLLERLGRIHPARQQHSKKKRSKTNDRWPN